MNIRKIIASAAACMMCAAMMSACSSAPENTVFSADDLTGKKIGVQLGTVGDIFASDVENAVVERYNKGSDAVQALKQGKIDAVIIDAEPAKVFVEKNSDLRILDDAFAEEEYAIAIKKGNTELTDKINGALASLKEKGVLDSIEKNWIGDEATNQPWVAPEGTFAGGETSGTIIMATNAEFPPYELMSGEDIVGFDIDMMKAVCAELNMELKIDNMEFDSIIAAVDSGKADVGVAGMTVTPDRLENVDFSNSYATSTQVIIVRK